MPRSLRHSISYHWIQRPWIPRHLVAAVSAAVVFVACAPTEPEPPQSLEGPPAFAGLPAGETRAAALFTEAAKVIRHPRCVNCHPAGDSPLQGDDSVPHRPNVVRRAENPGAPGMPCNACHQVRNFDPGRVPGAPGWALAPREAAWQGFGASAICAQLKDRARNGDRGLDEIVEHMAENALVRWAWEPGQGRQPAPGSHEIFSALIAAWADEGAACP